MVIEIHVTSLDQSARSSLVWGKEQTHSKEDPYVHEVSLCVREPQTAPQSPRMGGHRVEKTGC